MAGGYAVLGYYPSSSSSATYEVRRGGDGVLYCTCRGWVSNLNANRKQRLSDPARCKHTKSYVSDHPATIYGPAWAQQVPKATPIVMPKSGKPGKTVEVAVNGKAAPANWRDLLLQESKAAAARGIITPPAAAAAFAAEISHLDIDGGGVGAAVPIATTELDV